MQNYYNKNLNSDNFRDMLTKAWIELSREPIKINEISNGVFLTFKKFFSNKKLIQLLLVNIKVICILKINLKKWMK